MYKLNLAIFLCFFGAYAVLAMDNNNNKPLRHSSIRRTGAKMQLVKKTAEQEVDDDYYEFISNINGFEHLKINKIEYLENPKDIIIEAIESGIALREGFSLNDELPPGDYAKMPRPGFCD